MGRSNHSLLVTAVFSAVTGQNISLEKSLSDRHIPTEPDSTEEIPDQIAEI